MADDDEQNIDPRFDPAFQRGFEGVVGTTRRRPTIGTPSVLPAQQPVSRPTAPASRPVLPPEEPAAPRAVVESVAEPAGDDDQEPRRVNPFLVALAVIGIALIAVGGWSASFLHGVFTASMTSGGSGSGSPTFDYLWVLMSVAVPAVLVGLGLATLIGIVFVYAARWRR